MWKLSPNPGLTAPLLLAMLAAGCEDAPLDADLPGALEFSVTDLNLGSERSATVTVTNGGGMAIGPVFLTTGTVAGPGGATVPGSFLTLDPPEIATLNPGARASLTVDVSLGGTIQSGTYSTSILASVDDAGAGAGPSEARLGLSFDVAPFEASTGVGSLEILEPETVRRGDALHLQVLARDPSGDALESAAIGWSVSPEGEGLIAADGQFVAYSAGLFRVVAMSGAAADTIEFEVSDRLRSGSLVPIGRGEQEDPPSSDLWLHGDYAYVGTHVGGAGTLYVWDVSAPEDPVRTDSVQIDARVVNDVKVRADGRLAVITHEGSSDGANGVTLLDLSDPGHPETISRHTDRLETGVHNAWLEGDYLYLVADGGGVGLRILDISDPENPEVVSTFSGSDDTFLHDVYVRNGLAFLSHWDAGLIVLDVGNGMAGGSPEAPVEVSRILTAGGQTHNAWYWPDAGYVFVGEEDTRTPGIMHVVDFRDPFSPREVATFTLPNHTPHNFWLDEPTGILYMAWYGQGLRAVDVTGELLGELDRQGRELAFVHHNGIATCGSIGTCTWAPQLHRGHVFVSDIGSGLTVIDPVF
ncbi:MAG: hypothetical protein HKO53_10390 [Gemmatimonadetes bacterium]|nr:hypothetical protein [Gemmatimonadota bacterium]